MARFEDKVIIVTGGSSGIGQACVERFAKEGASVVCVSRRPNVYSGGDCPKTQHDLA